MIKFVYFRNLKLEIKNIESTDLEGYKIQITTPIYIIT